MRLNFNYLFKNATKAWYVEYTSNLDASSNGACIERIGTPISIVSIFFCATNFATVPPPPWSTFPSSPVCQQIAKEVQVDKIIDDIEAPGPLTRSTYTCMHPLLRTWIVTGINQS